MWPINPVAPVTSIRLSMACLLRSESVVGSLLVLRALQFLLHHIPDGQPKPRVFPDWFSQAYSHAVFRLQLFDHGWNIFSQVTAGSEKQGNNRELLRALLFGLGHNGIQ